jgi:hypothetical protein
VGSYNGLMLRGNENLSHTNGKLFINSYSFITVIEPNNFGDQLIGYQFSIGSVIFYKEVVTTSFEVGSVGGGSGQGGNPWQTVSTITTWGGIVVDATQQIIKIPTVGYNIAYNSTLLKGVNYLKPLGYWATGASFVSDVYLSSIGQQSWGETGLNTTVTGIAIGVGGWTGLIIQANYHASKAYMEILKEHPEWAPYPIRGFNH